MTYNTQTDSFLKSLPAWQAEVCTTLRSLIHEAVPDISEEIKFTDRPYFTLQGNVCALQATKDHINLFIYDPIAPDPAGLINQGQGNATARSIQIFEGKPLNHDALKELIKTVADTNRQGGWRKLIKLNGRPNQS